MFINKKKLKNKQVLIIGVKHAVQWNGGINFRSSKFKDIGLGDIFIKKDAECMKKMRADMRQLCANFSPDLVIEESGPYIKNQADIWKNNISGKKIFLEDDYGYKHKFVDAKISFLFGKTIIPSNKKREKIIALETIKFLKNKDVNNICLVLGSLHTDNIKKILASRGIKNEVKDLNKEDYMIELDKLFKQEKLRLNLKK